MRIGVQARELAGNGGTNVYFETVLNGLINQIDSHQLYIFHNTNRSLTCKKNNVHYIRYQGHHPVLADHLLLPIKLHQYNIDRVWSPKGILPAYCAAESVLTVHDLGYFVDSSFYPLVDRAYMKLAMKRSCKKADKIIAISNNTKQDIQQYTGTKSHNIDVIYHGVDEIFTENWTERRLESLRDKLGFGKRRILYGANVSKRKNWRRLIEAFNQSTDRDWLLVFTGPVSSGTKNELSEFSRIRHLGNLPRYQLPGLYQLSTCLVYPSLYEGFGLPVLEAMASGTPVITSNVSSLPEIVGNAGYLINPNNTSELSKAIKLIANNDEVQNELKARGKSRASLFKWSKTISQTHKILTAE